MLTVSALALRRSEAITDFTLVSKETRKSKDRSVFGLSTVFFTQIFQLGFVAEVGGDKQNARGNSRSDAFPWRQDRT